MLRAKHSGGFDCQKLQQVPVAGMRLWMNAVVGTAALAFEVRCRLAFRAQRRPFC